MNRLAKKSLTASVLLTMILSLMPAINARADGGYTARAVKHTRTITTTGGTTTEEIETNVEFQIDGVEAYCLNLGYVSPGESDSGVSGYTSVTVTPTSGQDNSIDRLVGDYEGKYRESVTKTLFPREDLYNLYRKLMSILYYGYGGGGSEQIVGAPSNLNPDEKELYRIATQFAIWHFTDNGTAFNQKIQNGSQVFKDMKVGSVGEAEWAYSIYQKLIAMNVDNDFYLRHSMTVYKAPNSDEGKPDAKRINPWQNMISIKSLPERESEEFEFSKTDINGTAELKDAKLQIQDISGSMIEEWISDGEKVHKVRLPEGVYIMKEITAPYGYEEADIVRFEVVKGNNGKLKIKDKDNGRVVMQDKPKPRITISKREKGTKNLLSGAKLTIIGTNGVKVDVETLTDNDRVVNLYYGEYTLSETDPPRGYGKALPIVFRVVDTGNETYKLLVKKGDDFVAPEDPNAPTTVIMYDEKVPSTPPNTPPDNPKTPPDKPNTPPTTPQNPNNGHSAPQVAGATRSNPGTPGTPVTPVTPSNGGHAPGVAGAQKSPETADATPIALLLGVMSFAAAGLGIFMHKWKKLG